jgi:ADP-ribose pyrophosphatase YjhB (NUDIX family)
VKPGGSGWQGRLPGPLYALVTRLSPVVCVDLLPYRSSAGATEIGLIKRADANGEVGWNLVGGGVYRGESIERAVERHLRETLGPDVAWHKPDFGHPEAVGEYMPALELGRPHDPRKHAVALTFVVAVDGEISAGGEALEFRWFPEAEAPLDSMGFGQDLVLRRLLPLQPGRR